MASPFGEKIALICASGITSPLKLKMTPSEIEEWKKGGVTGQASYKNTYYFSQRSTDDGVCVVMPNSNSAWITVQYDMSDILIFNP
jgi:hypothetical protein